MKLRTTYPTHAADGARRFVSVSEISSLECWRKYRWQRQGLRPIREFEALQFGRIWDTFIGAWWSGESLMRLDLAMKAADDAISDEARRVDGVLVDRGLPRPEGWQDQIDRMHDLLRAMACHYVKHYGIENGWKCVAQQVRFEVPFPSATGGRRSTKFWLHGVIDRVMQNVDNGTLHLVDDKTTAKAGSDFYDGFEYDLQLPLYSWAMRELGNDIEGAWLDVAAKIIPIEPQMRKVPLTVYTNEVDADGKPIPEMDPVIGADGQPERYKTGPRAGWTKMVNRKREALLAMLDSSGGLQYHTTFDLMMHAINENELSTTDYEPELDILRRWKERDASNPYFSRPNLLVNDQIMDESAQILRDAAPWLDRLPDIPMRNRFRCGRCAFKAPCIERDPGARADLLSLEFTTRDERRTITV